MNGIDDDKVDAGNELLRFLVPAMVRKFGSRNAELALLETWHGLVRKRLKRQGEFTFVDALQITCHELNDDKPTGP
jgi:hypothetical protein